MNKKVGVVGLGVMGGAIVTRLLETGHGVRAFDVNADAVARAVALGATAASTPAEAADAGVVILSLPNAPIVEAAAFGDGGAATGRPRLSSTCRASTRRPRPASRSAQRRPGTPGWTPPSPAARQERWPGRCR